MATEIYYKNAYENPPTALIQETKIPNWEARLALTLIEKWGMISGKEHGEDSAGRARARLMTPDEVVQRACSTAELAIKEFGLRGWLIDVMGIEEMKKHIAEQEDARINETKAARDRQRELRRED